MLAEWAQGIAGGHSPEEGDERSVQSRCRNDALNGSVLTARPTVLTPVISVIGGRRRTSTSTIVINPFAATPTRMTHRNVGSRIAGLQLRDWPVLSGRCPSEPNWNEADRDMSALGPWPRGRHSCCPAFGAADSALISLDSRSSRTLRGGARKRRFHYAERPFHLCELYKVAPPPISIFYAAIGKYQPSATEEHPSIVIGSKVARAAGRLTAHRDVHRRTHGKEQHMLDLLDVILLAAGLGFFALSIAYAFACDRL